MKPCSMSSPQEASEAFLPGLGQRPEVGCLPRFDASVDDTGQFVRQGAEQAFAGQALALPSCAARLKMRIAAPGTLCTQVHAQFRVSRFAQTGTPADTGPRGALTWGEAEEGRELLDVVKAVKVYACHNGDRGHFCHSLDPGNQSDPLRQFRGFLDQTADCLLKGLLPHGLSGDGPEPRCQVGSGAGVIVIYDAAEGLWTDAKTTPQGDDLSACTAGGGERTAVAVSELRARTFERHAPHFSSNLPNGFMGRAQSHLRHKWQGRSEAYPRLYIQE